MYFVWEMDVDLALIDRDVEGNFEEELKDDDFLSIQYETWDING